MRTGAPPELFTVSPLSRRDSFVPGHPDSTAQRSDNISEDRFFAAAGNSRVSIVEVRNIAAVAATALTESGHEGKTYDVTGPEALTHADMASQLSETSAGAFLLSMFGGRHRGGCHEFSTAFIRSIYAKL